MILWIIVGLVLLFSVLYTVFWADYARFYWSTFFSALGISAFFGGMAFGIAAAIVFGGLSSVIEPESQTVSTVQLRAISTENSVQGRSYFLGSGYINGDRQISYITTQDDYSQILSISGDRAYIHEDTEDSPYLDVIDYSVNLWWFAPWATDIDFWYDDYHFHIPAGSIQQDYNLSLQGSNE